MVIISQSYVSLTITMIHHMQQFEDYLKYWRHINFESVLVSQPYTSLTIVLYHHMQYFETTWNTDRFAN